MLAAAEISRHIETARARAPSAPSEEELAAGPAKQACL